MLTCILDLYELASFEVIIPSMSYFLVIENYGGVVGFSTQPRHGGLIGDGTFLARH